MRNAIETPRKRPVAGHSNAQKAYLKGIELLDPSHSHYILAEASIIGRETARNGRWVRGRWAVLPISAPCGVRQSLQFRLADSDPQNLLGSGYQSITHSVYIYGDSEPAVLQPRQNLRVRS